MNVTRARAADRTSFQLGRYVELYIGAPISSRSLLFSSAISRSDSATAAWARGLVFSAPRSAEQLAVQYRQIQRRQVVLDDLIFVSFGPTFRQIAVNQVIGLRVISHNAGFEHQYFFMWLSSDGHLWFSPVIPE